MAGFLSGLADSWAQQLDDRRAADAYAPLVDSVYGQQQPQSGGFLATLFGGGQQPQPVQAGAPAGSVPAAPGAQPGAAPGQPGITREAVMRLLANPQTAALGQAILTNGGNIPPSELQQRQKQFDAQQAWKEKEFAADEAHRARTLALQQRAYGEGRVPAGYRATANGVEPVPGGPQDPNALIQSRKAIAESSGLTPDSPGYGRFILTGEMPSGGGAADPQSRAALAQQYGLDPASPAYQSFVLTGKMPREDQSTLTATDRKAILEADEMVSTAQGIIPLLDKAIELSPKAFSGPTASARATAGNNLPDWLAPGTPDQALATTELDNVVQTQALSQLKAVFGAAPTEGERKILLDIAGSSSLPPKAREGIYQRAKEAVQRRLNFYQQRADAMRGGDYYKPGGTAAPGNAAAPAAPDPLGLR